MDKRNEKKYVQSPVVIICYILAALMLIYACYQGGSTVKQINEYYAGYGMSAKPSEYVMYVFQAMLEPVFHAIVIFMAGYILNAVRKLDSKNYKSAATGKDKGKTVGADFAESLDAELKADAKTTKSTSKKTGQSRSRSGSGSKSGSGSRSGSGSKSGSGTKTGQKKSTGSKSASGTKKSTSSSRSKSQASKKAEAEAKAEVKEVQEVKDVKAVSEVAEAKTENMNFDSNAELNKSQESEN